MRIETGRTTAVVCCMICAASILASAVYAATAKGSQGGPAYKKVWEGGLESGECYFLTSWLLKGNFTSDAGDELAAIDGDGFGHVIRWTERGFVEEWITSEHVTRKKVVKTLAADIEGDGHDKAIILHADGTVDIWGGEQELFRVLCRDCLGDIKNGNKIRQFAVADFDGDGREGIVAWAPMKDRNYLMAINFEGGRPVLFWNHQVKDVKQASDLFTMRNNGVGERYVIVETDAKKGARLVELENNEEGVAVLRSRQIPKDGSKIVSVSAGTTDENEDALYMLKSGAGGLSLRAFEPFGDRVFFNIGKISQKTVFDLQADLNGDGKEEIIFSDRECNYKIYSTESLLTLKTGRRVNPKKPEVRPEDLTEEERY